MSLKSSLSTRTVLCAATLSFAGPISIAASAHAQSLSVGERLARNVLYILNNTAAPGQNSVLAFHRDIDGSLAALPGSPFLTRGIGFAVPLTAPPGPFDGQNIMVADPLGGAIFVPNGGSDNVSALRTAPDGSLTPVSGSPFAIPGNTPEALGLSGRKLIVVNNATDPNQAASGVGPSYATALVDPFDGVHPLSSAPLAAGSVPTEALPLGLTSLVFTNENGAGTISEYFLDLLGHLHLLQSQLALTPSLGQDLNPRAPYLYVGLPGTAQIGVYRLTEFQETFVDAVATTNGSAASPTGTGNAPCWVRVSSDGRYAYSSNTASHSISVYDLRNPAVPAVVQTLVLNGVIGATYDFRLSPDGRFMYVIEGATAASPAGNQVHILSVNQGTGLVTEIAASPVNLGVAGHRVQGLLVF